MAAKTTEKYMAYINLCADCFAKLDERKRSHSESIVNGFIGTRCVGRVCHNLDCESGEAVYEVRMTVQEVQR